MLKKWNKVKWEITRNRKYIKNNVHCETDVILTQIYTKIALSEMNGGFVLFSDGDETKQESRSHENAQQIVNLKLGKL